MCDLGEITEVPLREMWPDEARDFTPWLERNIDILGDALGLELEVIGREVSVGGFSLDLHVRTLDSQSEGVIEIQYGKTNHEHLGKLLTYAGGLAASIVIWISEHCREEHREALDWLNRTSTETQYFAVELKLIRIDDSRPAPCFRPVVLPNEWGRDSRLSAGRNLSPRQERYRQYFQSLIDELDGFGNPRPAEKSEQKFASGIMYIKYRASFFRTGNQACSSIWIYYRGNAEQNLRIFDALRARQAEIEFEFGEGLMWNRMEDRTTQEIAICRDGNIDMPDDELDEIRNWHIEMLQRLKAAFGQELQRAVDAVEER